MIRCPCRIVNFKIFFGLEVRDWPVASLYTRYAGQLSHPISGGKPDASHMCARI
jgi:hypothetical protein